MSNTTGKVSAKRYRCTHCAHETTQSTNHYGQTYSWGRVNRCPNCGWRRPMDVTVWECVCVETMPDGMERPENWTVTKIGKIGDLSK